jgi:hypothetical protein
MTGQDASIPITVLSDESPSNWLSEKQMKIRQTQGLTLNGRRKLSSVIIALRQLGMFARVLPGYFEDGA